jgi:hypothetical protein
MPFLGAGGHSINSRSTSSQKLVAYICYFWHRREKKAVHVQVVKVRSVSLRIECLKVTWHAGFKKKTFKVFIMVLQTCIKTFWKNNIKQNNNNPLQWAMAVFSLCSQAYIIQYICLLPVNHRPLLRFSEPGYSENARPQKIHWMFKVLFLLGCSWGHDFYFIFSFFSYFLLKPLSGFTESLCSIQNTINTVRNVTVEQTKQTKNYNSREIIASVGWKPHNYSMSKTVTFQDSN